MRKIIGSTRFNLLLPVVFWSAAMLLSFLNDLAGSRERAMERAIEAAKVDLDESEAILRWGTRHGGVYVPLTERQQANPWMNHVPGRDVTTTDGRRLTLINPATMLRQTLGELGSGRGSECRITGLRYFDPANAPDAWEKVQLENFARGAKKEVYEVAEIGGQPYLRYLRPLWMKEDCVKCHGALGYQVGDLRGAIGRNQPLAPYFAQVEAARRDHIHSHLGIWLLGLAGIGLTGWLLHRRDRERRRDALRYRTMFEQAPDGVVVGDPETHRIIEFNHVAHEQLGYTREEFAALTIFDIEAIDNQEQIQRRIERIVERGWDNFETCHRHKNGSIRNVHVTVQKVELDGKVMLQGTFRDITERKQAEEALLLYASIFEHSGEAILVTDRHNRIVSANPALTSLTGYSVAELLGHDPRILSSGRAPAEVYSSMWAALDAGGFWQGELWDRRKDGSVYPKWTTISAIRDSTGAATHYIASFSDISERKAAEERIQRLAHHDALTGLFNRLSLEDRLGQALATTQRESGRLAVMFIDMDRFKLINDTLGHPVGDLLLVEVARRLQASMRESDIVARLGGDEFVVVQTGMDAAFDAAPVANKILHALGQPYELDGHVLHSSPSIGVSVFPDDGATTDVLMKNADTAMYHAKEQGRNNVQFFTDTMNAAAGERMELERDLRAALRAKEFELYYQPQVEARTERVCGVEALLRWNHPRRGMVPPLKFIPIAEEAGLIEALGAWVLDEACRQLAAWRAAGLAMQVRMAVNLSARQLRSATLVGEVRDCLARHDLDGADLELEVTESAAMDNPERAIGQLWSLRALGVGLAIDDFGTGYSSLAYLKNLPIQTLKLDRSFVRDIESDANDAAISAATLALAHTLGLKVVAEGVETEAQIYFLRTVHRCDILQGYYFGKPEPAATWTEKWRAEPPEG